MRISALFPVATCLRLAGLTPAGAAAVSGHRLHHTTQLSSTTLRENLIKVSARTMRHGRSVIFQLTKVAVPQMPIAEILKRIDQLRGSLVPAT